jgi:aryl-alcohol dehydrogenase-like predicted oxidoreductase
MLRRILGPTAFEVSPLGYGCSQLTTFRSRREAWRLLEFAFAEGITHFDVARGYGFGRAEGILAKFLQGKRDRVTVATKFGIQPPTGWQGNRFVIDTTKRLLRPFPGLLQGAKNHGSSITKSGTFTPAAAIESLEKSLHELRTDYIDILFLHEATLSDARNEALIQALSLVAAGKVRSLGIASDFEKLQPSPLSLPSNYQVIQLNDDAATRNLPKLVRKEKQAVIVHSVFKPLVSLRTAALAQPDVVRKFSSQVQLDLADQSVLGYLLLQHALASEADLVLFSSTSAARVSANVKSASTDCLDKKQLAIFTDFVDTLLKKQPEVSQNLRIEQ